MDAATMFSIGISLVIFVIFFILGYLSQKRSGGFFLFLAGFCLISAAATASSVLGAVFSLLVIFGVFIVLAGVMKAFYNKTSQPETGGKVRG